MKHHAQWPLQALREAVAPDLPDLELEVLTQIDSTNSELMRRARAGRLAPALLVAERQTAGRGRLGRQWFSQDGTAASLTFSLGLPLAPPDWSGLSLAVGIAMVRSLHPDLRLKWPNDLWWQARKLAGILIETVSCADKRYAIIGIGVNLETPAVTDLATPAAWLTELLPGLDAPQTLLRVAAPLVQTLKTFEAQGFAPFQASFNSYDALAGLTITLGDGTAGVAHGVDELGALRVLTEQGWRKITSAEVSPRPIGQPPSVNFQAV